MALVLIFYLEAETNDFLQKSIFAAHSTCGEKNRSLLEISQHLFDAYSVNLKILEDAQYASEGGNVCREVAEQFAG